MLIYHLDYNANDTHYMKMIRISTWIIMELIRISQVCLVSWILSIVLTSPLLAIANYHVSHLMFDLFDKFFT